MQIQHLPTGALRPPPVELRKRDKRQQPALKASINSFGIVKPILVDENKVIVAGYSVWTAAKALDIKAVPTLCISHLTPEQIRLYRIADNQIATLSSFDEEMLRLELGELSELSLHTVAELDLELTGFATAEIDNILLNAKGKPEASVEPEETEAVPPSDQPIVTRLGDLWIVGGHKIICANSLEEASYTALLGEELAQMVVTDVPYNVPIAGHVSSRAGAREFAFASGELSPEEFIAS
jgi:ParB-like chromosome segregation protein Spo0J